MRLTRTFPLGLLALAAALPLSGPTTPLAGAAPAAAAVCASPEVAAPGGLEVRAKPGTKVAEPRADRGGQDLLQGRPTAGTSTSSRAISVPVAFHVIQATPGTTGVGYARPRPSLPS